MTNEIENIQDPNGDAPAPIATGDAAEVVETVVAEVVAEEVAAEVVETVEGE